MKNNTRYFKVSIETLRKLAKDSGSFSLVAGFLVMARHASGEEIEGHPPYTFTGAGANSIKTKVGGMADARSNNILQELIARQLLVPVSLAPKYAKVARYRVMQDAVDLELPHALIDGLANTETPLHRVRSCVSPSDGRESLKSLSANDCQLDALMLLLEMYAALRMAQCGGVDPRVIHRAWEESNVRAKEGNFQWLSNPLEETSYTPQVQRILAHAIEGKKIPENISSRFWSAWTNLRATGLFYEAVMMFDANPAQNSTAKAVCTLRVNDFHSGAQRSETPQDPSLLAHLDTTLAFYTQEANDREEPEQMRFAWPSDHGHIIGVWRPRYRAATRDGGVWIEEEKGRCLTLAEQIHSRREPVPVNEDDVPF
ncbi:hypothetical protein F0160_36860 [Paraburkholderia sp. JPY303]|uniref:hypothetical protein n=1 Tax=Paraburkholderia atlantica TaxID=2654982 RepID=UPI00159208AA|nr:hypothetical protein [Paraburkholderia atlantica]NUY35902.1 hypothetical protein [Paraburkholderia atlantica]